MGRAGSPVVIATYEDKFGEKRVVHKSTDGQLRIKRQMQSPGARMNKVTSRLIGARIKAKRIERGLTLQELALRCGMGTGNPKERMWAIENATRNEGTKMGTLFVIAIALEVEATDLLPSVAEVAAAAGVGRVEVSRVA